MAGKKGLADIALLMKPKGPPPGADGPMGDGADAGDPVVGAMTDFLDAVHAKDPEAMADALHGAFDAMQTPTD